MVRAFLTARRSFCHRSGAFWILLTLNTFVLHCAGCLSLGLCRCGKSIVLDLLQKLSSQNVILASASPRRKEILQTIGLRVKVCGFGCLVIRMIWTGAAAC
jgi:hypothetical protein